MKPSVGRIVHYVLSEQDCAAINRRRVADAGRREDWPSGAQAHTGNPVHGGEHVAMVIVALFPGNSDNRVNGQVLLDGNDSYWVTSAAEGNYVGQWHWPEREED